MMNPPQGIERIAIPVEMLEGIRVLLLEGIALSLIGKDFGYAETTANMVLKINTILHRRE